jgi:hypothetical protein
MCPKVRREKILVLPPRESLNAERDATVTEHFSC